MATANTSILSAVATLAKTFYGEDPCIVFRAIKNVFPEAQVYLAVHCGRAHMSGSAEQFCRICGLPITGDLYQSLAANSERESGEQGTPQPSGAPTLNEEERA